MKETIADLLEGSFDFEHEHMQCIEKDGQRMVIIAGAGNVHKAYVEALAHLLQAIKHPVILVQGNLQSLEKPPPPPEPKTFIIEALPTYEEPILFSPKASYITGKTLPRKKKKR